MFTFPARYRNTCRGNVPAILTHRLNSISGGCLYLRRPAHADHFSTHGRHKTKRNVFSNAYILNHTVSPYSLYVSVVTINKGLHNFHSVFTRQQ